MGFYVSRDGAGTITGAFVNRQPGIADEWIEALPDGWGQPDLTEEAKRKRREAYAAEADPLFFSWQAAKDANEPDQDAKRVAWRAKRAEIQARQPMPE